MTSATTPAGTPSWQPPLAGTDAEQIVAALDRQRATLRWTAEELESVDGRTGEDPAPDWVTPWDRAEPLPFVRISLGK